MRPHSLHTFLREQEGKGQRMIMMGWNEKVFEISSNYLSRARESDEHLCLLYENFPLNIYKRIKARGDVKGGKFKIKFYLINKI